MRILVSNDDGITAPGLAALVMAVRDLGELTVAAPESPQSAMAHSITLREPLHAKRVDIPGTDGMKGFAVSGRPADCVRLAVRNFMDAPPDLVLSGINAGANVGVNIFYSGTVAAAAEGAMCGAQAVAFSLALTDFDNPGQPDFTTAARYCRAVLDTLFADGLVGRQLINVNVPVLDGPAPCGVRVAPQSDADVIDTYHPNELAPDEIQYRLASNFDFDQAHPDSDVALLAGRYITVTPLHVDITCHQRLDGLGIVEKDFESSS